MRWPCPPGLARSRSRIRRTSRALRTCPVTCSSTKLIQTSLRLGKYGNALPLATAFAPDVLAANLWASPTTASFASLKRIKRETAATTIWCDSPASLASSAIDSALRDIPHKISSSTSVQARPSSTRTWHLTRCTGIQTKVLMAEPLRCQAVGTRRAAPRGYVPPGPLHAASRPSRTETRVRDPVCGRD